MNFDPLCTAYKEDSPMEDSQGPLVRSPSLRDLLQTSPVELSPSTSSGGTYMWDEDGLEPFLEAGTQQRGSYQNSELSSRVSTQTSPAPIKRGQLPSKGAFATVAHAASRLFPVSIQRR